MTRIAACMSLAIVLCPVADADQRGRTEPPPDRTARLLEALTPDERAHADQFVGLGRQQIVDRRSSLIVHREIGLTAEPPTAGALAQTACAYADVFVGAVGARKSLPAADGNFVFSIYQVSVVEAFKGLANVESGRAIAVSRPGGSLLVDGASVTIVDSAYPTLEQGDHYLFMANRVPESTGYYSTEPEAALRVSEGRLEWVWGGRVSLSDFRGAFNQSCVVAESQGIAIGNAEARPPAIIDRCPPTPSGTSTAALTPSTTCWLPSNQS